MKMYFWTNRGNAQTSSLPLPPSYGVWGSIPPRLDREGKGVLRLPSKSKPKPPPSSRLLYHTRHELSKLRKYFLDEENILPLASYGCSDCSEFSIGTYYKTCCQPPWLELHLQVEASEQLTKLNLWRKLRNASFFVPGVPRRLLRESSIAWYQCFRRKSSVLHCPYFQGFIFIPLLIQLTYLLWHSLIGTNFKGVHKKSKSFW